ncbi:hypothetical protein VRT12_002980 [Citrobacter koseri]|nr:hypothetical protein [Citrobacter koseri]HEJ0066093.1 hypothetical protein [Citrobacter koseri]
MRSQSKKKAYWLRSFAGWRRYSALSGLRNTQPVGLCRMAALQRLIRPTEYATCWPVPDGGAKAPYPAYKMRNL